MRSAAKRTEGQVSVATTWTATRYFFLEYRVTGPRMGCTGSHAAECLCRALTLKISTLSNGQSFAPRYGCRLDVARLNFRRRRCPLSARSGRYRSSQGSSARPRRCLSMRSVRRSSRNHTNNLDQQSPNRVMARPVTKVLPRYHGRF